MISTAIFPGRYVQGRDAGKRLGEELSRCGEKGMVVCDPFGYEKILPDFEPYLKNGVEVSIEKFDGECSDEEIDRRVNLIEQGNFHFVVVIGGGKTMDRAKAVAEAADAEGKRRSSFT